VTEIPYVRQPIKFPVRYAHGPDSFVQPDVPRGALHEYALNESRVFPETRRRYWAYVPALYTACSAQLASSTAIRPDAVLSAQLHHRIRTGSLPSASHRGFTLDAASATG